jgi:hypothetical protein
MKYTIFGLKLAKRTPWIDAKGNVIDDGVNHKMVLCSSDNEKMVDFFMKSVKDRVHGKSWKIWKEITK